MSDKLKSGQRSLRERKQRDFRTCGYSQVLWSVGDGVRCCRVEKPRTLRSDYPDHPTALHLTVLHPHVNPLFRAWAATPTYGTDGPRAEDPAHVQNRRFTFEQGTAPDREYPQPRAHQGARQSPITGNIPKRRPPRPQQPISDTCRRGSLHFGRLNTRAGLHTEEMGL